MSVAIALSPQIFTGGKDDLAVLDALTRGPLPNLQGAVKGKGQIKRRDAPLDPLLLAATAASGPHVTRHHYHHGFQPGEDGMWAWSGPNESEGGGGRAESKKTLYTSRQAPRRQRLAASANENQAPPLTHDSKNLPPNSKRHRPSLFFKSSAAAAPLSPSPPSRKLDVKCMARTRIPTPHGEAFLHLYHNNQDGKEHLAIVVDPTQLSDEHSPLPPIRSKSLDAVWHEKETTEERLIRGAYAGRLSSTSQTPYSSRPSSPNSSSASSTPAPLVRIHSECFTGETIGSQRCDCGEQLDEALRLIFQTISLSPSHSVPGRGAVVYLRQEGRGIGLLSKIRAYNLQDMGHDTVTANLLLGHKADERGYDIACAILRDLGLSGSGEADDLGLRLLTNNPTKVLSLVEGGVNVSERVPMVPRSWTCRQHDVDPEERAKGATMIGAGVTSSPELDKYLRTKVERMGHMLSLPSSSDVVGVTQEEV